MRVFPRHHTEKSCKQTVHFAVHMKVHLSWRRNLIYKNMGFPLELLAKFLYWEKKNPTVATVYWNKTYHLLFVNGGSWTPNFSHPYTYLLFGDLPTHFRFSAVCITESTMASFPPSLPEASVFNITVSLVPFPPTNVSTKNMNQQQRF